LRRFALPLAQVSAAAGRAQRPRAPRTNAAAFWCRRRRRVCPCLRLYGVPSVAGSLVVPATDGEGALRESPGIAEVV